MKKRSGKRVSRKGAKGAKVTGRGPSSRADARDLRRRFLALLETRISPGVYPELAEGVEMTHPSFAPLRPFDVAQGMLCGRLIRVWLQSSHAEPLWRNRIPSSHRGGAKVAEKGE